MSDPYGLSNAWKARLTIDLKSLFFFFVVVFSFLCINQFNCVYFSSLSASSTVMRDKAPEINGLDQAKIGPMWVVSMGSFLFILL